MCQKFDKIVLLYVDEIARVSDSLETAMSSSRVVPLLSNRLLKMLKVSQMSNLELK